MSLKTNQIADSTISRVKILPVLAFAACLVFPTTAYAHSAGPVIVLALVVFVSAAILAGFTKWLMKRFSFAICAEVPGTSIIKGQIAETLLMIVSSFAAFWVVENALPLQVIGYFSLEGAKWYYSNVVISTTPHLFISQEILWWTLIQAVLALLPNLALLKRKEDGSSQSLAGFKKFVHAFLLGLIALAFIWALIAVTVYPSIVYEHEHYASKKQPSAAKVQAELMRIACSKGFMGLARRIASEGFDVNSDTDSHGMTPLMWASFNGHIDLVEFLLDRGADINQQASPVGITALMCAASGGRTEVVKELLRRGAKTDVIDKSGLTALELAERSKHAETAAVLKQWASDK
jgi:Ankyrin repeats (3 copies)/Ankyrin repeat